MVNKTKSKITIALTIIFILLYPMMLGANIANAFITKSAYLTYSPIEQMKGIIANSLARYLFLFLLLLVVGFFTLEIIRLHFNVFGKIKVSQLAPKR